MPEPAIVTASLMRVEGETGVQTHVRTFHRWLVEQGLASRVVTPFDAPRWQVYPLFGLRRIVEVASKAWGVWWYRHWHGAMLRRALRVVLHDDADCVIYAQCPVSAAAALAARASPRQRVVRVVHFNVSQALEWEGKGALTSSHAVYHGILELEAAVLHQVDALVFVSEFMRRAAMQEAQLAILNETLVRFSPVAFRQFAAAIEAPIADVPAKMRERLARPAPWSKARKA